jgi:hypothetical protein
MSNSSHGSIDRDLLRRTRMLAAQAGGNQKFRTVLPDARPLKQASTEVPVRKANLPEFAIQEAVSGFGLTSGQTRVFLFEDHKIARASFLLPDICRKISTRAFLMFLEQQGLIEAAADVERAAILAGRQVSQIRCPPV